MRRIISWIVCALFIVCILISFRSISANEKEEKEYIYDDTGRVIEVILSNGDREIYSYDKNGNIISVEYIYTDKSGDNGEEDGEDTASTEQSEETSGGSSATTEQSEETSGGSSATTEQSEETSGGGSATTEQGAETSDGSSATIEQGAGTSGGSSATTERSEETSGGSTATTEQGAGDSGKEKAEEDMSSSVICEDEKTGNSGYHFFKKLSNKKLAVTIIVVAIVLGLIGVIFVLKNRKKDKGDM